MRRSRECFVRAAYENIVVHIPLKSPMVARPANVGVGVGICQTLNLLLLRRHLSRRMLPAPQHQESQKGSAKFSSISSVESRSRTALRFIHNHFGTRLTHVEPGIRFLDLRGVFFHLGCERFYLLLLLR